MHQLLHLNWSLIIIIHSGFYRTLLLNELNSYAVQWRSQDFRLEGGQGSSWLGAGVGMADGLAPSPSRRFT